MISLFVFGACNFDDELTTSQLPVIEAFLYAHEPVNDIHIFSSIAITGDTAIYPPIIDAQVTLSNGGNNYQLTASAILGHILPMSSVIIHTHL